MEVERIAVIGAGAMGSGIAYVSALYNFDVYMMDVKEEYLENGMKKIRQMFMTGVERGKVSPKEAQEAIQKIKTTIDISEACKNSDLVIEAVFENMDIKKDVFSKMDKHSPEHAILATNTSTLSVTEIAKATQRPDKVCGMHFFNPVPAMKLVEIVVGEKTSKKSIDVAIDVSKKLRKEVVISKDGPGFIFNRILIPTATEILKIHEEGIASMEHIDQLAMKGPFPMGPFTLLDYVGLDIALHASETLYKAFGEKYKPSELLKKTVEAGHLGLKTGKGLRDFDKKIEAKRSDEYITGRIINVLINEACKCSSEEQIASIQDIDKAMRLGGNFKKGPFELADEIGIDTVFEGLKNLEKEFKNDFYKPSLLLKEKVSEGNFGKKSGRGFYEY